MKQNKKVHLGKWIIPFVIASLFTFTGLAIYLQFVTQVELSSTLITCFFGFCTGELWMLASIKKTKIKNQFVDDPSTPEDESQIDYDAYNKGVGADGYSTMAELRMTVRVNFTNRSNPKDNFESRQFSSSREYDASQQLASVQDELVNQMIKDIVDQIFNATVANW